MKKDETSSQSGQNPETYVAQEIFSRDRGAQREMPLNEFLAQVEEETRGKVKKDRRDRHRGSM